MARSSSSSVMNYSKISEAERAEAVESLRKLLKPGMTVHPVLRHAASSGMFRVIDLVIAYTHEEKVYPPKPAHLASYPGQTDFDAKPKIKRKPAVRSIGWLAAKAMRDSFDRDRQGIRVGGCGMDMGFHLVYSLGSTIWPKGTPKPHGTRNGEPDRAGGYALKSSWL